MSASKSPSIPLAPGGTIGILGGGQLGRMMAHSATRLGYRVLVFADDPDCPGAQVAGFHQGKLEDQAALQAFADKVDVITLEFENIPLEAVRFLSTQKPLFPGPLALETAQDRIKEKTFFANEKIACARWWPIFSLQDLQEAWSVLAQTDSGGILKTARFGYDGHGQIALPADTGDSDLASAWEKLGPVGHESGCVLEERLDLLLEFSMILSRNPKGDICCYPATENRHQDQILIESRVPASITPDQSREAENMIRQAAVAFDYVGVLAMEFFVTKDGRLLANEMAPRPHNSGHWTIEGAVTSQFEQAVRSVCGLPLGATAQRAPQVRMKNLLGRDALNWADYLEETGVHLHLYGKNDPKEKRKMGHLTYLEENRT